MLYNDIVDLYKREKSLFYYANLHMPTFNKGVNKVAKTKNDLSELGKSTRFTSGAQAAEMGRKGRLKRMEKEREQKTFKEEILKRMNASDWEEIVQGLTERAKTSDKAFELLRDTIGQKPTEHVEAVVDSVNIVVNVDED